MGKLIKGDFTTPKFWEDGTPVTCVGLWQAFEDAKKFNETLHTCPAPQRVVEAFFVPKEHQSMYPLGGDGDIHTELGRIEITLECWRPEGFLQALPLDMINEIREYFLGPIEPAVEGVTKMVKRLPYKIQGEDTIMLNDFDPQGIEDIVVFKRLMNDHGVATVMWGLYEYHVKLFKEWFEQHSHMVFSK